MLVLNEVHSAGLAEQLGPELANVFVFPFQRELLAFIVRQVLDIDCFWRLSRVSSFS